MTDAERIAQLEAELSAARVDAEAVADIIQRLKNEIENCKRETAKESARADYEMRSAASTRDYIAAVKKQVKDVRKEIEEGVESLSGIVDLVVDDDYLDPLVAQEERARGKYICAKIIRILWDVE